MWNLYIIFGFLWIVVLSFSFSKTNVLLDKTPPRVIRELEHGIKFFSDKFLRLECNIDGTPRPSYQWYVSTSDMGDMSNMQELLFEKVNMGSDYMLEINGNQSNKKFFKYVYYCAAQNPLGILLSNKIIVEKVSHTNNIHIKYTTSNVYEGEKIVIQCSPIPDLWAGLYKFIHWEIHMEQQKDIYLNKTEGRYSIITSTKIPQLHIRNVTSEDFERTKVRCAFQSIVDNSLVRSFFKPVEKLNYDAPSYLSNICWETVETITVNVESNVELPWCSMPKTLDVIWYKVDNFGNEIEIGTKVKDPKYQMISHRYGNLLIMNVTKEDSGKYMALTKGKSKQIRLTYTLNVYEFVTVSLNPVNIEREFSEPAEFQCTASYSKSQFYWLHNGQKVSSNYDDGNVQITSTNNQSILQIKKTRLSVVGVYQCIAAADNELKAISEYRQASTSLLLSKLSPILYKQSPRAEKDTGTAQIQMSTQNPQKTIECVFASNPKPTIDWKLNAEMVPILPIFNINIQSDTKSIYNLIAKLTINLNKLSHGEDIRQYAGEYHATAETDRGSATCKTFVLMDGPLELRLPVKQTAVGGKDHILSCYFVAMGVPEFTWDRKTETGIWESMPSNHRTIMRDNNYKLLLKNVVKGEDEGIYRCTAKFNKETKNATTSLAVANPPNLQNLPLKQDISESNYHICTVNNKADKPWYVWWTFTKYNNNETVEIKPDKYHTESNDFSVKYDSISLESSDSVISGVPSFLYKYPNKGVNLNIKERSYDKSALGKFTCHAKNHIGSAELSIEDNYLSLEFKIVPPSTSEVVVGNDLYLNCTAKESDLDPITKWKISLTGDKYIEINDLKDTYDGRIFQYNNGTLVIKNIRESDPYRMFCFIIPTRKNFEVQSKVAYIDIRVPARVQQMTEKIFKIAGTSFNLTCNIYGHTQNLEVTWFYRLNAIGQWQRLYKTCIYSKDNHCINPYQSNSGKFNPIIQSYNETYHYVSLEFHNAIEQIAGLYKCEAANKFSKFEGQASTHLTIISKPGEVTSSPTQRRSTAREIQIQWEAPLNDGHRPILGYIIKYLEIQPNQENNNVTETIRVNKTVLFIQIEKLRPYRTYEVAIAAENEVGIGEANIFKIITQEAKPEQSVRSLKASSTQPDAILITWDDPEPQYQNGKIIRYSVCYQIMPTYDTLDNIRVSQLSWPNNFEESNNNGNVKCDTTKYPTYSVSSLPQFTDFGIRVIAFTIEGASPAAFTKVRTLEDLPQAPPTDLTCQTQQQTINLMWNPPSRQTINGVLIGYVVNYYKPNKYGDESDMFGVNVQGATHVILDQLEPYTSYSIQVMAANRKGLGPPSIRIICQTAEAKPEAPISAKAVRSNGTCLIVSWLHTPKPNGKILFYCIIGGGIHSDNPKCQSPDFSKRYNYMTLCTNQFDHYYPIKVYARNKYDGAYTDVNNIKEEDGIISIGGTIYVNEGSTILLPCETSKHDQHNVVWKRDNQKITEIKNSNLKVFPNNSLEIKSLEKYGSFVFQCMIDHDSITYNLNVLDYPDGLPRPPNINDPRVTENSIFISWKSRGSKNAAAPITGFTLVWTNLHTGESKTISLDGSIRTYYLKNVTCASDFNIKIRSSNAEGKSDFSDVKKLRTLGTVPQLSDSNILLPIANIEPNSVNFNLNAFGPGENCSATSFQIEIGYTATGPNNLNDYFFHKNISVYELEDKCCYKKTGLHPSTPYRYKIVASNPAGSTMNYNTFTTPTGKGGFTQTSYSTTKPDNPNTWIFMIILTLAVIFIIIILVIGILYICHNKQQVKRPPNIDSYAVRKNEYNPPKKDRTIFQDDNASVDSNGEPSPYAVYQPENDQKANYGWPQQVPQTSSTPGYNYPDHPYNQIRYDKIHQNANHDYKRRVNSAECLSSLGNASMSGNPDLESPSNIDPSDFIGPDKFNRYSNNDDVFNNLPSSNCLTVYRPNKRSRRESENLHYPDEERVKLVNQNQKAMINIRNDPMTFRSQPQTTYKPGNHNMRLPFHQQMSVPDSRTTCIQPYGYSNNRARIPIAMGASQTKVPSSSQTINYGNYYETNRSQMVYPNPNRGNSNSNVNPSIEPYSKYVPTNHMPIYASQPRTSTERPEYIAPNGNIPSSNRTECSDDEIYTDKVVVV